MRPLRLADSGQLDYLTLEYLAELTLSILAHQRAKNPDAGFVTDVPRVAGQLAPHFRGASPLKLVTNGGGMHPAGSLGPRPRCWSRVGYRRCGSPRWRATTCSRD